MQLLNDCKDVALLYDDVLFVIQLYFGSGIFGIDDLIANLNFHLDFLAVYNTAGAYCYDFCLLGFFLILTGEYDTGLGSLLCN